MGGNVNNTIKTETAITSNFLQESTQVCAASAASEASNNTVIVEGTVNQGINISSTSQADAKCSMTNNVSQISENMITDLVSQAATAEVDFLGDLAWTNVKNNSSIYESIATNMTQITSSSCLATDTAAADNNFVYVTTTGTVNGGINFTTSANANASCVMQNTSKMQSYNQVLNNTDQTAKYTGMFVAMFNAVVSVIIILMIVAAVLFTVCEIGSVFKAEKCKETGCEKKGSQLSDVAIAGIGAAKDFASSPEGAELIKSMSQSGAAV